MEALFLFLGLFLGLWLAFFQEVALTIVLVLLYGLLLIISAKQGKWVYFLLGSTLGVGVGLFAYFLTPFSSPSWVYVIKVGNGYVIAQRGLHRYYLADYEHHFEVGDILRINGFISPFKATTYESQFDFGKYLSSFGVKYELSGKSSFIFKTPLRLREKEDAFLAHFEQNTASLLSSLLFARSSSSSIKDSASGMNLLFAISTSGFFLSVLCKLVEHIASFFFAKKGEKITGFIFVLFFFPLALRKIGIARLILVKGLSLLFEYGLKKPFPAPSRIGISGITLLIIDFHFAFQSGFLISFGLSLYFGFLAPLLINKKKWKKRIIGFFFVRLFLLPLSFSSGGFHLFSALYSVVLIPFSFLLIVFGYLSFLTFPFAGLLNGIGGISSTLINAFSSFDPVIPLVALPKGGIAIFYVVLALSLLLSEVGLRRARNILVFGYIGMYVVSLIPFNYVFSYQVSFINVGQGDAILLRKGSDVVMIDTGGVVGKDLANETLIPFLRKQRIYHVNAIIASHGDYDHIGASSSLMASFKVDRFLEDVGPSFSIGSLSFINYNVYQGKDENDTSSVLWTKIGGVSYLFTGDASTAIESQIVRDNPTLRCDILKVGHHGSNTSSSEAFLDLLQPKVAIISCGAKNRYGHPDKVVLDRLEKRHIEIRRTDLEGTITYYGLGKG